MTQRFFETNEQAAAFAKSQDERGLNVYHACATFKDDSSRKQTNVLAVRSLWLDVDCGPSKPYADWRAALDAIRSFLKRTGLPQPVFVGSGRGLHVYWPLRDSLSAAEWLGYARGLKAQCELHGLAADPVRTCDAASILRPVGTHNRKHDEAIQVSWGGPTGPYEIEEFGALKQAGLPGIQFGRAVHSVEVAPMVQPMPPFDWEATQPPFESEPSNANEIADRCQQIGSCRNLRGKIPEPLWHASLGVLAWCEDGPAIAHEWSSGDHRYTAQETQRRIDRVLTLDGPTTCEKFKSLNAKGCEGCRFSLDISSPIGLGRPPYTTPVTGVSPNSGANHILERVVEATQSPLPEGYFLNDTGLYLIHEESKTGHKIPKYVSRTKFHLLRISEVDNDQEGTQYVFSVSHPHDGNRDLSLAANTVHGANGCARMAGLGIPIESSDLFRNYLNAAVAQLRAERKATVTYKQYGFKENDTIFVLGDRAYTGWGVTPSEVTGSAADRAKYFKPKGTLDGWTGAASLLCAPGCEAQQFAILASAAAPLMRFHAQDEGGAIFSQATRESGTGKTTSFDAAQTFWGDKDGLAVGATATANARGIILATNCNIPVFFDEASQRDAEELRNFVQMFTDGIDRQRARVDGGLNQNPLTWQTVLLCASNVPMLEVLGAAGGSEAMMYRILEVAPSLPEGLNNSAGEALRRQLKQNSGNAADRYLKCLGLPATIKYAKYWLERHYDEIGRKHGFDRKARFIIRLLSAVRVAGDIVKQAGILHCNPEKMMEWGIEKAKIQINGVPSVKASDALINYLNFYHDDILTVQYEGRKMGQILHLPRNQIRGRYETETGALYIALPPFRKWLSQHDYGWPEVQEGLHKEELLAGVKLVTLTAGTSTPGGQIQSVQIIAHRLGFCFDQQKKSNVLELRK